MIPLIIAVGVLIVSVKSAIKAFRGRMVWSVTRGSQGRNLTGVPAIIAGILILILGFAVAAVQLFGWGIFNFIYQR